MTLVRRFLVLTALRWLPTGLLIPVTAVFMQSRGLSLAEVGLALAVQGGVVLVLELPTGGLADSIGRRKVLLLASSLDIIAVAWFAASHSFAAFVGAWTLQGIFRALDSGPLEAWYVDESLAEDSGADIEHGIAAAGTAVGVAIATGALGAAGLVALGPIGGVEALVLPILAALVLRAVDLGALAVLLDERRAVPSEQRARRRARRAARRLPRSGAAGARRRRAGVGRRARRCRAAQRAPPGRAVRRPGAGRGHAGHHCRRRLVDLGCRVGGHALARPPDRIAGPGRHRDPHRPGWGGGDHGRGRRSRRAGRRLSRLLPRARCRQLGALRHGPPLGRAGRAGHGAVGRPA